MRKQWSVAHLDVHGSRIFGCSFFFFFNDTATTEIYTLSLHDALPICQHPAQHLVAIGVQHAEMRIAGNACGRQVRSEEHTSELQSPCNLVCRLLLEKKKKSVSYPSLIL